MFHAVNLGRVEKALHVFAQTENRGAAFRRVAANAFEYARAVVQHVGHYVHARVVPFDELTIAPHEVTNSRSAHVSAFAH